MTQPPAAFLQAAIHYSAGYRYGRGTSFREIDCCRYVEAVLRMWLAASIQDYPESRADLNIYDGKYPWSPIQACRRMGIAKCTNWYAHGNKPGRSKWRLGPSPGPSRAGIFVCQGWDDPDLAEVDGDGLAGGHTFFIWSAGEGGPSWIYEATNADVQWARPVDVQKQFDKFDAGVRWAEVGP